MRVINKLLLKNSWLEYTKPMKKHALNTTNQFLKKDEVAKKMRVRSIASSTAIETGQSIQSIETKLNCLEAAPRRVTLA